MSYDVFLVRGVCTCVLVDGAGPVSLKGSAVSSSRFWSVFRFGMPLVSVLAWAVFSSVQFSSVAQSCSTLCDPMNHSMQGVPVHHQLPESLKLMSIELVMPSSHLILCCPLFLLPPVPPSIRVFSNESALCMRWPKYWSFSFSISPSRILGFFWRLPRGVSPRLEWGHARSLSSRAVAAVPINKIKTVQQK